MERLYEEELDSDSRFLRFFPGLLHRVLYYEFRTERPGRDTEKSSHKLPWHANFEKPRSDTKETNLMRKPVFMLAVLALLVVGIVMTGTGCKKKVQPPPAVAKTEPPPPPPPAPAPTITLSASPPTIERGQSSNLSWNSSNATSVTIDGGVGSVEPSGSRSVRPSNSTTYNARANGPGGSATASARVTVTAPPPPPPPAARPLSDAEIFERDVKDAYFDYDKYDIRDDARSVLQGNARALVERTSIRFTIEGHCDERGSEKYNLALGDRRANAAKSFLANQGVAGDRVDTISYGKERNVCTEHNEDCWQRNRRAHFIMR